MASIIPKLKSLDDFLLDDNWFRSSLGKVCVEQVSQHAWYHPFASIFLGQTRNLFMTKKDSGANRLK